MADTDIPFLLTLGEPENQTLQGPVIGHFSTRSILKKWQPFFNFFIMANADIPFPLTLGKPETQTLGGSVIRNFFSIRLILKKWPMLIFHFRRHSENLRPKLWGGGVCNWKFFRMIDIKKMATIFQFFIMANADVPFPSTLGKPETQTLRGSVIGNFSVRSILKKWQPF